jgi:hypothetical protein
LVGSADPGRHNDTFSDASAIAKITAGCGIDDVIPESPVAARKDDPGPFACPQRRLTAGIEMALLTE